MVRGMEEKKPFKLPQVLDCEGVEFFYRNLDEEDQLND